MNSAVILAGGSGLRMESKTPKQFLLLNEKRILDYSINTFCNNKNVNEVVIVCHPDWLKKLNYDGLKVTTGGDTRTESVLKGLNNCDNFCKNVIIHDSSRPFITDTIIDKGLKLLSSYDAAIPIVDIDDSIIQQKPKLEYLNRNNVKRIQTPQFFNYKKILEAHKFNKKTYTDDLSHLLNYFKDKSKISYKFFKGSKDNFKITTQNDYEIAKRLLL